MKHYLQNILFLSCLLLMVSCSDEEAKTQSETALRPAVPPVVNNEVQIGTQIWMTKNLNVSRYRNGAIIPQVTDPTEWANLTTGAWCYDYNDTSIGGVYGKLYNWYAVNDPRGLAPNGWHIPSDDEWATLTTYLGGLSVAGGELKESGISHWRSPNAGATNNSGFTAIPGGYRDGDGTFHLAGANGYWWTSSESSATNGINRRILYDSGFAYRSILYGKGNAFSIRCVKD